MEKEDVMTQQKFLINLRMWAMRAKWYCFLHAITWRTCKGIGVKGQKLFTQRVVVSSFSLSQSQGCLITAGHELVSMSCRQDWMVENWLWDTSRSYNKKVIFDLLLALSIFLFFYHFANHTCSKSISSYPAYFGSPLLPWLSSIIKPFQVLQDSFQLWKLPPYCFPALSNITSNQPDAFAFHSKKTHFRINLTSLLIQ